jgi:hypothetical protein
MGTIGSQARGPRPPCCALGCDVAMVVLPAVVACQEEALVCGGAATWRGPGLIDAREPMSILLRAHDDGDWSSSSPR